MHGILGQQRAGELLQQALVSDRMHHAWIFAGRQGIGKRTTAMEVAKILLDPNRQQNFHGELEAEIGGEVDRLISAGTHPDVHLIERTLSLHSESGKIRRGKQTNIPIDVLRQFMIGGTIQETGAYHEPAVSHSPKMGVGKVFVIDEAELLDQYGQNALLKTLEEPPGRTWIFLITSSPERLTATIRSRCQLLRFDPLDDDAMAAWMEQSGIDVADRERSWLLQFAEGSPGLAQTAAAYGFFKWYETLMPMLNAASSGRFAPELGPQLGQCVEDFAAAWVKGGKNRSKDMANKDGCRHLFRLLSATAREQLMKAASNDDSAQVDRWLHVADVLRDAERSIFANVNLKLVFENLAVQWASGARRSSHGQAASMTVGA